MPQASFILLATSCHWASHLVSPQSFLQTSPSQPVTTLHRVSHPVSGFNTLLTLQPPAPRRHHVGLLHQHKHLGNRLNMGWVTTCASVAATKVPIKHKLCFQYLALQHAGAKTVTKSALFNTPLQDHNPVIHVRRQEAGHDCAELNMLHQSTSRIHTNTTALATTSTTLVMS